MNRELKLRIATFQDLPLIKNLLQENQLPDQDIADKLSDLFIASIEATIIGIGGLEIYEDCSLLRSLVIKPRYRDQGYGKVLTTKLIKFAQDTGGKKVYLLTTSAVLFFTELGFEKVDRNSVPPSIKNTSQFTHLCPESAICLLKVIMKKVMFVCKKNSARSQMAEGFAKALGSEKIEVISSGLEASQVRPEAITTMRDIGIDISHQTSKALSDFNPEDFDVVISLCGCGVNLPTEWLTREVFQDWQLDDPAEQPEIFPRVRDEIKIRVTQLMNSLQ